jgi:hypothetical protein
MLRVPKTGKAAEALNTRDTTDWSCAKGGEEYCSIANRLRFFLFYFSQAFSIPDVTLSGATARSSRSPASR